MNWFRSLFGRESSDKDRPLNAGAIGGSSGRTQGVLVQRAILELVRDGGYGVSLVMTDLVDSTALLSEIGDQRWSGLLDLHRERLRLHVDHHGGVQLDANGDGSLNAFRTVEAALRFSEDLVLDPGDKLVQVRAGIHYGEPYIRNVGLCGSLVHFVSRVMSHGKGPEIWCSDSARKQLLEENAELIDQRDWYSEERCQLKGVQDLQTLWRVRS